MTHRSIAFVLLASCFGVAHADELYENRYDWFEQKGVYDTSFDNNEANKLINDAIHGDDPKAIEHVVRGMGMLAAWVETSLWSGSGSTPPIRRFQNIPGIKEFLVDYWRTGEGSGAVFDKELPDSGMPILPAWQFVPGILAVYFPNALEVHDFIWEIHDPTNPIPTLRLLNAGGFKTPEATAYRIQKLNIANIQRSSHGRDAGIAFEAKRHAAKGLALYQTDEGLQELVKQLELDDHALPEVVEAIVAYGLAALPYLEDLREVSSEHPDHDKIKSAVRDLVRLENTAKDRDRQLH